MRVAVGFFAALAPTAAAALYEYEDGGSAFTTGCTPISILVPA